MDTQFDNLTIAEAKEYIAEHRNEVGNCPLCHRSIKDRKETNYKGLIRALYRVYRWCGEKQKHEFKMSEIKHLLDYSAYTRFGNLIRYGGIVYRPQDPKTGKPYKRGVFGINMQRAREFFKGERPIQLQKVINKMTRETEAETYVYIKDLPELHKLLTEDGFYDTDPTLDNVVPITPQKKNKRPTVEEYKQSQAKLFEIEPTRKETINPWDYH